MRTVVGLRLHCDEVTVDDHRARLLTATGAGEPVVGEPQPAAWPGRALSPQEVEAEVASFARSAHVRVLECAVLSDGSEVVLLDDRGWSSSVSDGSDPWRWTTREQVEQNARNVVLPDDAEVSGEDHEWDLFVERLAAAGLATDAEALKALPYEVVLGARLRGRFA